MLRRYAPTLQWDIVLATEAPDHPICKQVSTKYSVLLLPLSPESAGFLESRRDALNQLLSYTYCFPLQEDFILEGSMDSKAIEQVFKTFENPSIVSARLMPCPGPVDTTSEFWVGLTKKDTYHFVFQATLWKTKACLEWYTRICFLLDSYSPKHNSSPMRRLQVELKDNLAENAIGQAEFQLWSEAQGYKHIAWVRRGPWANAVYLCPFPYRPTAIVKGRLEPWVNELAKREGFTIKGEGATG
jgi:hypothetical protein